MSDTNVDQVAEFQTGPGQEQPVMTADAAFIMYTDADGHWIADPNFERTVLVHRLANTSDYVHAAADVAKDIAAFETAQRTVNLQQQMASQMMQAQQAARIAAQLGGDMGTDGHAIDLSALKR